MDLFVDRHAGDKRLLHMLPDQTSSGCVMPRQSNSTTAMRCDKGDEGNVGAFARSGRCYDWIFGNDDLIRNNIGSGPGGE